MQNHSARKFTFRQVKLIFIRKIFLEDSGKFGNGLLIRLMSINFKANVFKNGLTSKSRGTTNHLPNQMCKLYFLTVRP